MKKWTKFLCLLLTAGMLLTALAACADKDEDKKPGTVTAPNLTDEQVYDEVLGEFYTAYQAALAAENVSERYALMAIAEAKLMESGIMVPLRANGGNYAVSKVVPYTITPVLWGNDSDRYHNALVATTPIKTADREHLKSMWKELQGTGTYEAKAKEYLEGKGYTFQRTYTIGYSSDLETWDVLASSNAADAEVLVNTYDGLLEYDGENVLRPALATALPEVSADGLTYTFKIREGVKWVDFEGRELANVTANDFVTGFQHMLDAAGGLEYLVQGVIVGVDEYLAEEEGFTFDKVGVKAVDEYTLQYTLVAPCSYFETMFGYGVFAPMLKSFYENLGGEFGIGAEAGTYGTSRETIAYCGPYIVSVYTNESQVVFDLNESYWNKDNINIDKITWNYNDGSLATKAYSDFKAGVLDGCGLNTSALAMAKEDKLYDDCIYVSGTDATSFPGFFNVYRRGFVSPDDETALNTTQDDQTKARTAWAMLNTNFRLAMAMSLNRGDYMAQSVGDDLKYASMVNSYTPGNFVKLTENVTVKINGNDTTFAAGTYYGAIMQAQIDADGFPAKVWDPTQDDGLGSSSGYDGWYNVNKAKEYLNKAIEELAKDGVEISAENPIHVEYVCFSGNEVNIAMANAVKSSIEAALEGKVIIDLLSTDNRVNYLYSSYYFTRGDQANYNLSLNSGWGPDYGDPSTFLDTMVKGGGYMLKCIGLMA